MSTASEDPDRESTRRQSRQLAYALCVLFAVGLAIGAANLLWTNSQVHALQDTQDALRRTNSALLVTTRKQERQIQADCVFYGHLAGLPVTTNITTGKPTRLSVQLISDVRVTWRDRDCPGMLPPPDPSFTRWARAYGLPAG
jgi:hypothetical protein